MVRPRRHAKVKRIKKKPPPCDCGSTMLDENDKIIHYQECAVIQYGLGWFL